MRGTTLGKPKREPNLPRELVPVWLVTADMSYRIGSSHTLVTFGIVPDRRVGWIYMIRPLLKTGCVANRRSTTMSDMTVDIESPMPYAVELEAAVFAAYGGVMATISTLERNLHLVQVNRRIALAQKEGRVLTVDPFLKAARMGFQELVNKVAPQCDPDPSLASDLTSAVKRRNYLCHDFWYENVNAMLTDQSRRVLLAELIRDAETFEDINDRLVQTVVDPSMKALGLDPEVGMLIALALLKAHAEENK